METISYKSYLPEITLKYKKGETRKIKIKGSKDVQNLAKELFNQDTLELTEEFIVLYLNRANNTIGWFKVSQGGISATVVDVRLIMKVGLDIGASGFIMMHNHPSGELTPSNQDISITKKVKQAGDILDITMLDHLIITAGDGYYSFADNGLT